MSEAPREIKFRVWEDDADFFVYFSIGDLLFGTDEVITSTGLDRIRAMLEETSKNPSSDPRIQRYTGLKDKNRKDVYEGDIVKKDYEKYAFVVSFGEGSQGEPADGTYPYWGWYLGGEHYLDPTAFMGREAEVIGNIYENPGLLKEE